MADTELLRRAAERLRVHAEAATPGPWSADETGTVCAVADLVPGDGKGGLILPEGGPMEVAECYRNERSGERGYNAAYIELMHPPVALALADLLQTLSWMPTHTVDMTDMAAAAVLAQTILREEDDRG